MNEAELESFRRKLLRLRTDLQALDKDSEEAEKPVELDQARVGTTARSRGGCRPAVGHEPYFLPCRISR